MRTQWLALLVFILKLELSEQHHLLPQVVATEVDWTAYDSEIGDEDGISRLSSNASMMNWLMHELQVFSIAEAEAHGHLVRFLPPEFNPAEYDTIWQVALYTAICLFGIIGNLRVIVCVSKRLLLKDRPQGRKFRPQANLLSYILALSIIDTLVLLFQPLVIVEMILDQWPFGRSACKLFWSAESLNKVLSTFLLVALSSNCYVAVCKPTAYHRWKSVKVAIGLIVISVVTATVMMVPIFLHADVYGVGRLMNDSSIWTPWIKCMFFPPEDVLHWFTLYTFGVSYVLTMSIQLVFYGLLLGFLYRHWRNLSVESRSSSIPFWNVVKTVLTLVIFYFVCWTPYWILTMYTYARSILNLQEFEDKSIPYIVHALPYINAAFNPTLYSKFLRNNQAETASGNGCYDMVTSNGCVQRYNRVAMTAAEAESIGNVASSRLLPATLAERKSPAKTVKQPPTCKHPRVAYFRTAPPGPANGFSSSPKPSKESEDQETSATTEIVTIRSTSSESCQTALLPLKFDDQNDTFL